MRSSAATSSASPAPAFRWTAAFCALAVWALSILAGSPQLHAALHHDADHQDHTCAVTLFSHGVESATGGAGIVCGPVLFPEGEFTVQPALPVAGAEHQLPPACGPPHC